MVCCVYVMCAASSLHLAGRLRRGLPAGVCRRRVCWGLRHSLGGARGWRVRAAHGQERGRSCSQQVIRGTRCMLPLAQFYQAVEASVPCKFSMIVPSPRTSARTSPASSSQLHAAHLSHSCHCQLPLSARQNVCTCRHPLCKPAVCQHETAY